MPKKIRRTAKIEVCMPHKQRTKFTATLVDTSLFKPPLLHTRYTELPHKRKKKLKVAGADSSHLKPHLEPLRSPANIFTPCQFKITNGRYGSKEKGDDGNGYKKNTSDAHMISDIKKPQPKIYSSLLCSLLTSLQTMDVNELINQAEDWDLEMIPDETRVANRNSLIGKVLSERQVNELSMRGMIRAAWLESFKPKINEMPRIKEVDKNTFILDFDTKVEMEAIWEDLPCLLSGTLLQLKRWTGSDNAAEINFNNAEFWIQVHNLPEVFRTEGNISMVKSMFNCVIDLDRSALDAQLYKRFARVFVEANTKKPLLDGFYLRHQQKRIWVAFKYERLMNLCYLCGKINHSKQECEIRGSGAGAAHNLPSVQRWGPWTRANTKMMSPRSVQQHEADLRINRDASSTSNSPGGQPFQTPPTNSERVGPTLGFSPLINQIPLFVSSQNFPFQTDLSPPTVYISPHQNNPSPLFQNQTQFPTFSQTSKVSRNLFEAAHPSPTKLLLLDITHPRKMNLAQLFKTRR
ncbi:unnamed protein product [Linum trigynum]|uniref:CCHC-type domain-containing protein n=1 Tax=Linum trigynum TaxID=586398 RepID=A0AAV2DZU5_9ROSI